MPQRGIAEEEEFMAKRGGYLEYCGLEDEKKYKSFKIFNFIIGTKEVKIGVLARTKYMFFFFFFGNFYLL